MYKTYVQGNFVLDDNDQDNYASISGKPATDLKTMQSRLIQWVIYLTTQDKWCAVLLIKCVHIHVVC